MLAIRLRFLSLALVWILGCAAESAPPAPAAALAQHLAQASVTLAPRVKPGGALSVAILVQNTGTTTLQVSQTRLVYSGEPGWSGGALALAAATRPGADHWYHLSSVARSQVSS